MIRSMHGKSASHKLQGIPLIKCLTECEKGEEVRVLNVKAGFKAKRRLANLGIVPGTIIKKQKEAPFHGPLGIIVKGTQLVLGRGLAAKIFVECDNACPFE
jgi:Fe2+ transport system protein FeoA